MTQHQNTELLPCPYVAPRFGIGDIVVPSDECPYRNDYRGMNLIVAEVSFDPARDEITYSTLPWPNESKEGMTTDWPESDLTLHKANAWNTRPAKAVQRDLEALSALDKIESYFDPVDDKNIGECVSIIRAALTPESEGIAEDSAFLPREMTEEEITAITAWYAEKHGVEGIAGKGDAPAFEKGRLLGHQEVFDRVKIWLLNWNLSDNDREDLHELFEEAKTALSPITRPQEIDVEHIYSECHKAADKKCTHSQHPYQWINAAIDHLASSGYLSAPDGKKE